MYALQNFYLNTVKVQRDFRRPYPFTWAMIGCNRFFGNQKIKPYKGSAALQKERNPDVMKLGKKKIVTTRFIRVGTKYEKLSSQLYNVMLLIVLTAVTEKSSKWRAIANIIRNELEKS